MSSGSNNTPLASNEAVTLAAFDGLAPLSIEGGLVTAGRPFWGT